MGKLQIMGRRGDDRLDWTMTDPESVKTAEQTFAALRKQGYAAFAVGPGGAKAEQVQAFDPTDEELILVPPVVGGLGAGAERCR